MSLFLIVMPKPVTYVNNSLFFMVQPRPPFRLHSVFFKQTSIQSLQQINFKNVHPVYCAGIRTHNLLNMSRLP